MTRGVFQYKDQGDIRREVTVSKAKNLKLQQEHCPDELEDGWFEGMFDADIMSMLGDTSLLAASDLSKGKGKSMSDLAKGKGKGKGKGRQLALEDTPRTEEQLLEDAQLKCRKMRDLCSKTLADLELSIQAVKKSKFWSKVAQKDADELKSELEIQCGELKMVLLKKSDDYDKLKSVCLEAAGYVKSAIVQMKEFKGLVHKTASKASTRK